MKIIFCIYDLDYADHIAIAYLSAVARERGHARYFCCLRDSDLTDMVRRIQPDIVAYSTNIYGFEEMLRAHRAAARAHDFMAIMGGPQATFSPDTFSQAGVDAYCRGEGELAFDEFLECVEQGRSFDAVANLTTAAACNSVRHLIANLDDLPFPDRDLTLDNSFLKDTPKKTFYATRGCPFKCKYCCNNYYHELYAGKGKLVRRFSVDRLIHEIEYVKAHYRTDFIKFGDDLFALKADAWLEEFAARYAREIGIPFNCYLRFDRMDPDLLGLLKSAGCYSVHLSVDSTSELVREKILGRRMKKVDIPGQLRMVHDHGINTWVNFMLAAPESTLEDDLDTIDTSRRGKVTYASYSTTVPMQGTELYDYCLERGLIDPASHKSDMTGCSQPSTLTCFTEKDKNIRFNIYLLGALLARLPRPLLKMALGVIRVIPPNRLMVKARQLYYKYNIENTIFKLRPQ